MKYAYQGLVAAASGLLLSIGLAVPASAAPSPCTITVSDPAPITEGDTGTTPASFTVSATSNNGTNPCNGIVVNYTFGGTAVEGVDYTPTGTGSVTLGSGANNTTQQVPIPFDVINDTADEPTDTLTVAITSTSAGADITDANGSTTIVDNDAAPEPVTEVVNEEDTSPFTRVAYQNGPAGADECGAGYVADGTVDQVFVDGPGTPPEGNGSLRFTIDEAGEQQLFRTAEYNGVAIRDIRDLSYSTYVETAGKQPPYLRLSVDTDNDGTADTALFFYPSNNGAQQAVATGVWQTWDVAAGTLNIGGDPGTGTTTLADFGAANPDAVIADTFAPSDANPNEAGGLTVAQGCGGTNTSDSVSYVDAIAFGAYGDATVTYDLEGPNTAPPAGPGIGAGGTLTVSPTSGAPGTVINISGTACQNSTVHVVLAATDGQSGGIVAEKDNVPVNGDGTFSTTLTVPANSNPDANYALTVQCGSGTYPQQTFDVTPAGTSSGDTPTGTNGYRMVAADGGIFTFGARVFHGSTGDLKLNKPIVGGATNKATYDGYWIVASDGGVFTFNAPFYGSLGDQKLSAPATEIEPTPTGKGYWIVTADGKVFTFGDANHYGDMAGKALNKPIIGMSVTPTGKGYWLVGEDGGIFNFGDAGFFGSTGAMKLNAPVIDLAPSVDNNGYYLLAKDGGVFTFGSADFKGSTGNLKLNAPVIAMLVAPNGAGYWLAATDGGIFTFGAVDFLGSMGGTKLNSPVLDLIN